MFRRTAITVALVSAAVCTASASQSTPPLPVATPDDVAKVTQIVSDSSTRQQDPVNYEVIRNNAARACLRTKGHRAAPLPAKHAKNPGVTPWQDHLQWVTSGKTRFTAYAQNAHNVADEKAITGSKYALSEEAGKLFWGYPEKTVALDNGVERVISGCYGHVAKDVFGVSATTYENTVAASRATRDLADTAANHPLVREKSRSYSRCMKQAGFQTPTPAVAPVELQRLLDQVQKGTTTIGQVATAEQKFTTADRHCKTESGVRNAFVAAYLANVGDAHESAKAAHIRLDEMRAHARGYAQNNP